MHEEGKEWFLSLYEVLGWCNFQPLTLPSLLAHTPAYIAHTYHESVANFIFYLGVQTNRVVPNVVMVL